MGVSINNRKGKEGYKKQRRGMYKAEGGMGMRLGERGSEGGISWTTPPYAQIGPSGGAKEFEEKDDAIPLCARDGCREVSGCRLGQRPCMTRTPQRTGGRHTELLRLVRHLHALIKRVAVFSRARHDAFPQYPPSCVYSSLLLVIGLRRFLPLKLVLPS